MPLTRTASSGCHPALRATVGHCAAESPRNGPPPKAVTSPQGGRVESARAALPVLAVLVILLGTATVRGGAQASPILRVESNTGGEVEIDARGVTIEEALWAIASKAGFEVVLDPGTARPLVNMAVSMAPVEDVLRQILRGRNYALVYDAGDVSLSQVIVLPPPSAAGVRPAAVRHR